ncbi:Flagellar hook-length control protein FliK [Actinokineospora spheciospongiae]|uniref:Flagellar hook-length control protein FliK n=1 Tax=Actinokineospora spheciospongiae TaxID=909613 RepID=W7IQW7_9PSEU|nr:Flagellar hook-length control protein FliK [Actinokineospora spheciospongiae]
MLPRHPPQHTGSSPRHTRTSRDAVTTPTRGGSPTGSSTPRSPPNDCTTAMDVPPPTPPLPRSSGATLNVRARGRGLGRTTCDVVGSGRGSGRMPSGSWRMSPSETAWANTSGISLSSTRRRSARSSTGAGFPQAAMEVTSAASRTRRARTLLSRRRFACSSGSSRRSTAIGGRVTNRYPSPSGTSTPAATSTGIASRRVTGTGTPSCAHTGAGTGSPGSGSSYQDSGCRIPYPAAKWATSMAWYPSTCPHPGSSAPSAAVVRFTHRCPADAATGQNCYSQTFPRTSSSAAPGHAHLEQPVPPQIEFIPAYPAGQAPQPHRTGAAAVRGHQDVLPLPQLHRGRAVVRLQPHLLVRVTGRTVQPPVPGRCQLAAQRGGLQFPQQPTRLRQPVTAHPVPDDQRPVLRQVLVILDHPQHPHARDGSGARRQFRLRCRGRDRSAKQGAGGVHLGRVVVGQASLLG